MTLQIGQQIITTDILLNISRSKDNQSIKLDQLIEYNVRNIFLRESFRNEGEVLVPDLSLFLKKLYVR